MMWDTKREKDIALAPGYPYEPLAQGECLVPSSYANMMSIGDNITFEWSCKEYWEWIVKDYNKIAEEAGWRTVPSPGYTNMEFNCTVKDFMDSTYGKMATDNSDRQVIMEFAPWFTLLSEHLPRSIENMRDGIPPEFMDWLREPSTAFSFSSILVMTLPSPRYKYYEE